MAKARAYNVTQWGVENPAGALMHDTFGDTPSDAWRKFRKVAGMRSETLAYLEGRGYTTVRVRFLRVDEYRTSPAAGGES